MLSSSPSKKDLTVDFKESSYSVVIREEQDERCPAMEPRKYWEVNAHCETLLLPQPRQEIMFDVPSTNYHYQKLAASGTPSQRMCKLITQAHYHALARLNRSQLQVKNFILPVQLMKMKNMDPLTRQKIIGELCKYLSVQQGLRNIVLEQAELKFQDLCCLLVAIANCPKVRSLHLWHVLDSCDKPFEGPLQSEIILDDLPRIPYTYNPGGRKYLRYLKENAKEDISESKEFLRRTRNTKSTFKSIFSLAEQSDTSRKQSLNNTQDDSKDLIHQLKKLESMVITCIEDDDGGMACKMIKKEFVQPVAPENEEHVYSQAEVGIQCSISQDFEDERTNTNESLNTNASKASRITHLNTGLENERTNTNVSIKTKASKASRMTHLNTGLEDERTNTKVSLKTKASKASRMTHLNTGLEDERTNTKVSVNTKASRITHLNTGLEDERTNTHVALNIKASKVSRMTHLNTGLEDERTNTKVSVNTKASRMTHLNTGLEDERTNTKVSVNTKVSRMTQDERTNTKVSQNNKMSKVSRITHLNTVTSEAQNENMFNALKSTRLQFCKKYLKYYEHTKINFNDLQEIYMITLTTFTQLTELAVNYCMLADGTGQALLSIGSIVRGKLRQLKLLCEPSDMPSPTHRLYDNGALHTIPDLIWHDVEEHCPDLKVHVICVSMSAHNVTKRFVTKRMPLCSFQMENGFCPTNATPNLNIFSTLKCLWLDHAETLEHVNLTLWHSTGRIDCSLEKLIQNTQLLSFVYHGPLQYKSCVNKLCDAALGSPRMQCFKLMIQGDPCFPHIAKDHSNDLYNEYRQRFQDKSISFVLGTFNS